MVDVCLASTAAPLVRAAAPLVDHEGNSNVFIDGGLFANNPVIVGVIDSMQLPQMTGRPIEIYSLGTYSLSYTANIKKGKEARGFYWWKFGSRALMSSIDAQDKHYRYMPTQLLNALQKRFSDITDPVIRERVSAPFSYIEFYNHPTIPEKPGILQFDNASETALDWLVRQAHRDAEATHALSLRPQQNFLLSIRQLFESRRTPSPVVELHPAANS